MRPLSWIVGLDTSERCIGALRLAAWLQARARPPGHAIVGVHVVEPARLAFDPEHEPGDPALVSALSGFVERIGAATALSSIEVMRAPSPADGLAELVARSEDAGLLVGRAARAHGWSLSALGPTARRLVRALPGPVCVVPPDHEVDADGRGVIVLALEPDEMCLEAARLAIRLAEVASTTVQAVHVLAPIDETRLRPEAAGAYEPFPTTDRDYVRLELAARDRIEAYLRAHDLDRISTRLEHGAPAKTIDDFAAREHASMIVCGSRRLGTAGRIFTTSVGTDLAAHSTRPVLIVPPRVEDA